MRWYSSSPVLLLFAASTGAAEPDLAGYRTVETAITVRASQVKPPAPVVPGFLGVYVAPALSGQLSIAEVAANSPAARAGLQPGDLLDAFDGAKVNDEDTFHEMIRTKSPREQIKLALTRKGKPVEVTATLTAPSRPMVPGRQAAVLGVQIATAKDGAGVVIESITAGSAAERAKLKIGQVILKADGVAMLSPEKLTEAIAEKNIDEAVTLTLRDADKTVDAVVMLDGERNTNSRSGERRPQGFGPGGRYWTRPTFRLGIIGVEYPDVKHNPKITPAAWQDAMFSKGTYTKTSVTGQQVYGSMYDYYLEQSFGALKIEGKAFDYVEVSKKRAEYSNATKSTLLTEALDKLVARGKDALKDLDGVFFIYAGERFNVPRGSLYWPHRATVSYEGKRWPYFICPEGGARMMTTSVFCHEFGHMLGLPDLYARPENPGMEGVGVWSAMANQVGNGRPQHFDAWCKEKLGWIKPVTVDPTVKQKLILRPIEESAKECIKIPIQPDGSEYLLLENRRKKGFDQSLPADGLLIWRVVGNRPILEESHGVAGPSGPRSFIDKVPYPSVANDSFTPFTIPSSRSQLGGGSPVYITNITRLADGRIAFQIGYEYY